MALKLHRPELNRQQRREEAERVIEAVGLSPAADILDRYPYELCGGQRQRIGFAQALAHQPKLILADEPVSMLDVSIRIGLLNLMAELRESRGRLVPLHHPRHRERTLRRRPADRSCTPGTSSRPARPSRCWQNPKHPYTDLLLGAVPDPRAPLTAGIEGDTGEPPKVIDPTPGCRFRWRCPLAVDRCHSETPLLRVLGPNHQAACHVAEPDTN